MTNQEALAYIDNEFERMAAMSIHGEIPLNLKAVLKMVFIAGMSAALAFPGDDEMLGANVKAALKSISTLYGNRTIFPLM